jgi:hypothetical protein
MLNAVRGGRLQIGDWHAIAKKSASRHAAENPENKKGDPFPSRSVKNLSLFRDYRLPSLLPRFGKECLILMRKVR